MEIEIGYSVTPARINIVLQRDEEHAIVITDESNGVALPNGKYYVKIEFRTSHQQYMGKKQDFVIGDSMEDTYWMGDHVQ